MKQLPFNLFIRYSSQLSAPPLTEINEQHRSKKRRQSHDTKYNVTYAMMIWKGFDRKPPCIIECKSSS